MGSVYVRTHGGLGNQMFQLFYGGCLRDFYGASDLGVIHDLNYPHRFELCDEFKDFECHAVLPRLISRVRIPKVLEKQGLNGVLRLPRGIFLDGYFQQPSQYSRFSPRLLNEHVEFLRSRFEVRETGTLQRLVHFRAGDFFDDERSQRDFIASKIETLEEGDHVISNRDDLLQEEFARVLFEDKSIEHIVTEGWNASDLLRLMSRYSKLVSNDSTLAFWSAVLGRAQIRFKSQKLNQLYQLFLHKAV